MGDLVVQACLSSVPFVLMAYHFGKDLGGAYLDIRNQGQVEAVLMELRDKIDSLEAASVIEKKTLLNNHTYQEVAHQRLVSLSSMDSAEDIRISSNLIAMSALITGRDNRDKYLLRSLIEITTDETKLLFFIVEMQQRFRDGVDSFNDLERRDLQSWQNLSEVLKHAFDKEGQEILGVQSFEHLLSRMHSMGLIDLDNSGNFRDNREFWPKANHLGKYFIASYEKADGAQSL